MQGQSSEIPRQLKAGSFYLRLNLFCSRHHHAACSGNSDPKRGGELVLARQHFKHPDEILWSQYTYNTHASV